LNKDDGNAGWATFFLNKGYSYILSIFGLLDVPTEFLGATVENAEIAFTAPEIYKK